MIYTGDTCSSSFISSVLFFPYSPHLLISFFHLIVPLHLILLLYVESKRGCPTDHGSSLNSVHLRVFSSVVCQGVTTLAYIPMTAFLEIVGETGLKELRHAVYLRQQQALLGGGQIHASMKPRRSIFSMPDRLELTKKVR